MRKSLVAKLGDEEAKQVISEAIYFISIGSNDYMGGYLGNPKMQESYHPEEFVGIVIGNSTRAIQVNPFSFSFTLTEPSWRLTSSVYSLYTIINKLTSFWCL